MAFDPSQYVLWSEEEIRSRVDELAGKIAADYSGGRLYCLIILRGSFLFGADLVRKLQSHFSSVLVDFVRLSSYAGTSSTGDVKFHGALPSVAGYDVLVIEDLMDTGLTLTTLNEALHSQGAASVKYAVLVDKTSRREASMTPDYCAFELKEDKYIVGYGMDAEGEMRALPYVAYVPPGVELH